MVFSNTWNSTFEGQPGDSENVSQGASRIRDHKEAVRERMDEEHYWGLTDGNDQGIHKFPSGAASGRPTGKTGRLYVNTEYNTIDFYDGGSWQVVGVPKDSIMLFLQSAAPAGWTKLTDAKYNDAALRMTTGSPGENTSGEAFSDIFATGRDTEHSFVSVSSSATGITVDNTDLGLSVADSADGAGLTISGHALTQDELPTDRLFVFADNDGTGTLATSNQANSGQTSIGASEKYTITGSATEATLGRTSPLGSGNTHTHGVSGTHGHTLNGTTGNHNHSLTDSGHSHGTTSHSHSYDLEINYVDAIVCQKA